MDIVWGAVSKLYGEHGASLTNLSLIDYDAEKKTAVIRTALATVGMVRTSLASITSVANKEAAVHVVAVSGTLKALHKQLEK
jgi:RNase P/RNase MRP subunit POP5